MKVVFVIVLIGAVFLILRYFNIDFSNITIEKAKEKIRSFGVWGPVVYIAFYIVRPLILFPAAVLSASAGAIWGLKGLIYLLIGAYISAFAEFFIARYAARELIDKMVKGKMADLDKAIEKNGFMTVLLIRLIPNAPWDIQNLSLGLTKVKFRDYLIATLIGILPGSFALVYFGDSFISVITNPAHFWKIIVATGLLVGVYYLQMKLRAKKGAAVESDTEDIGEKPT